MPFDLFHASPTTLQMNIATKDSSCQKHALSFQVLICLHRATARPHGTLAHTNVHTHTRTHTHVYTHTHHNAHSQAQAQAQAHILTLTSHIQIKSKCQAPYQCDAMTLSNPKFTVSCPGELQVKSEAFGINSSEFQGRRGYADFLFSLTDNPFLFRGGEVKATRDFIDSATETAKVILVFFTPEAGLTSVLTWTTEFMADSAAEGSITLEHYEMLEGTDLQGYLAVQIGVLVFVVFIVIDSLNEIKKMVSCVCSCVFACMRVCNVHGYVCARARAHHVHIYIHICHVFAHVSIHVKMRIYHKCTRVHTDDQIHKHTHRRRHIRHSGNLPIRVQFSKWSQIWLPAA